MNLLPGLLVFAVAALLLASDRRGQHPVFAFAPLAVLLPLALAPALAPLAPASWTALVVALVIALLARDGSELLHGECAVKLLWVMGPALAFTWAGEALLTLATGTAVVREQWGVLALGLDPRWLWSTALPLTLLIGLVMLGGAPFHFWPADLFQGSRPWLGPLAVAALQTTGAAWLARRVELIEEFPEASRVADGLMGIAAMIAFTAGAVTLLLQRRPERRVGTLASLNGALVLAMLVAAHAPGGSTSTLAAQLASWSAHLVLAFAGAAMLARFVPVSAGPAMQGAALFRRHPITALVGLLPLFSLAGVPGTPGAAVWLMTARDLAATGRNGLLLALAIAWLAAFATAVRQAQEAFGVPGAVRPEHPLSWRVRLALWAISAGLAAHGLRWLVRG